MKVFRVAYLEYWWLECCWARWSCGKSM